MKHRMRGDVVAAFESFLKDVNENIDGVTINMEGKLDTSRNKITKAPGSSQGAGLHIVLEHGPDGEPVTYSLRPPALGHKQDQNARSLRLRRSGEGFLAIHGGGVGGAETVYRDQGEGMQLERAYARAVNSMSFGCLFDDDPASYLVDGSRECTAFMRCLDALEQGPEGARSVAGMSRGRSCQGPDGQVMDGDDPLERMAAWSALSFVGAYGNDRIGDVTERSVGACSNAMGLGALRAALEKAAAGEPLADLLDPATPEGRGALRGLSCLTYYKTVQKEGGMRWEDRGGVKHVETADDKESVFLRGAYARHESAARVDELAELYRSRAGVAPYYCYQKMLGGRAMSSEGTLGDQRVDKHQEYRFYRCVTLGEDPDKASGMPRAKLTYRGDAAKPKADPWQVFVDDGSGKEPVRLHDVLSGNGPMLAQMPALQRLVSVHGPDKAAHMAADLVAADYRTGPDILELEMEAYKEGQSDGSAGRREVREAADMWAAFQVARHERIGRLRIYSYSRDHMAALPDFAHGCTEIGSLYLAPHGDLAATVPSQALLESTAERRAGNGPAAAAFRKDDAGREVLAQLGREDDGPRMAASYLNAIETYGTDDDTVRGSMMINDLMVLTETYTPGTPAEMDAIVDDVRLAYCGDPSLYPETAMYRPLDGIEADALKRAFPGGPPAMVPAGEQGTLDGFEHAMEQLYQNGGDSQVKRLEEKALDHDTLRDTHCADLAARSRRAMQRVFDRHMAAASSQLSAMRAANRETDAREADDINSILFPDEV